MNRFLRSEHNGLSLVCIVLGAIGTVLSIGVPIGTGLGITSTIVTLGVLIFGIALFVKDFVMIPRRVQEESGIMYDADTSIKGVTIGTKIVFGTGA